MGVSLDKDKKAWLQAIEKDKLPWYHISDLKGWGNDAAALYGVRSIPANVLFDPNGKIIAKNLTGKKLRQKMEEVFKD